MAYGLVCRQVAPSSCCTRCRRDNERRRMRVRGSRGLFPKGRGLPGTWPPEWLSGGSGAEPYSIKITLRFCKRRWDDESWAKKMRQTMTGRPYYYVYVAIRTTQNSIQRPGFRFLVFFVQRSIGADPAFRRISEPQQPGTRPRPTILVRGSLRRVCKLNSVQE